MAGSLFLQRYGHIFQRPSLDYGEAEMFFLQDPAVVRLSQSLEAHLSTGAPPVNFAAYIVVPSLYTLILAVLYLSFFRLLTGSRIGRQILLKYPEIFTAGVVTKQGPTPKQ
jgi:hypothetical protein